jgi:ABC-type nitrate/sulfonate/bicarbonate transport system substrate-binding protein
MSTATLDAPVKTTASNRTQVYYTRCPAVPTNSSLAYQLGFIDEELARIDTADVKQEIVGLDPKLKPDPGEPLSFRHAGHVKALWARSEGADNRVISLSWLEGTYPILALDRRIQSVIDLQGKRLALFNFKDTTTIDLIRVQQLRIYEASLATAQLTLKDVRLVDIDVDKSFLHRSDSFKPGDVFAALNRELIFKLVRGEVDAVTTQLSPEITNLLGTHVIYDTRFHPHIPSRANPSVLRGVVVSGALLRENRDLVVRILASHLEVAAWALKHPDETIRLISKDLKVPESLLRSRYVDLSQGLQVDLNEDKIGALRDLKDFYLRNGFIQKDFDIDAWVDGSPLEEARELLKKRRAKTGAR